MAKDTCDFLCNQCGYTWQLIRKKVKNNGFPKHCPNRGCMDFECECGCTPAVGCQCKDCGCGDKDCDKNTKTPKNKGGCKGCNDCGINFGKIIQDALEDVE